MPIENKDIRYDSVAIAHNVILLHIIPIDKDPKMFYSIAMLLKLFFGRTKRKVLQDPQTHFMGGQLPISIIS